MFCLIAMMMILSLPTKSILAADSCPTLSTKLDGQKREIDELVKNYETLNEKFSQSVREDYTALAEGLLNELSRNETIKLAFTRKKLLKTLETKRVEYSELKTKFCAKCPIKEGPTGKKISCERCPENAECKRSPASRKNRYRE